MKPDLDYCAAANLLVFPPVSEGEEKVSYTAWFSSFPDTTGNTPLLVRAPAPLESKQQGVVPARFALFLVVPLSFSCSPSCPIFLLS
jgi:hypothetical protein